MPRGVNDPDRPRRIASAAVEVIAESGIEGLTHRAVAERAHVPLGSTTYHFKTRDDMMAAAIVEAKRHTDAELEEWSDNLTEEKDLVEELVVYLQTLVTTHWTRTVVEHELYLAALRRPLLKKLSHEWQAKLPDVLSRHTDRLTAEALSLAFDGLLLQSMILGAAPDLSAAGILRRITG